MRVWFHVSMGLFHPGSMGARVALAAGSLAGLAVLGACSDGPVSSKVAGPEISAPRFGIVGSNAHKITICIDPLSTAGTYNFAVAVSALSNPLELPTSSDPDLSGAGIVQNSLGPFNPGDMIVAAPSLTPGNCSDVFVRNETLTHVNNRLWNVPGQGVVNPYGAVDVSATVPAGYGLSVICTNDDPSLPQTCANPGTSSANVFHGSSLTYTFTAPAAVGCTYTQGYYKNHETYTAGILSGNAGTTYVTAGGKLKIGAHELTAAQVDAILGAAVGQAYNQGGVVFTKAQLAMIHQLITAELNIAGGADGSGIAALITAANNYGGASKAQLSVWTDALADFNEGQSGPEHCDD